MEFSGLIYLINDLIKYSIKFNLIHQVSQGKHSSCHFMSPFSSATLYVEVIGLLQFPVSEILTNSLVYLFN